MYGTSVFYYFNCHAVANLISIYNSPLTLVHVTVFLFFFKKCCEPCRPAESRSGNDRVGLSTRGHYVAISQATNCETIQQVNPDRAPPD